MSCAARDVNVARVYLADVMGTRALAVTGEEEDELLHSVRCKLFAMHEGSWVERGTGLLKLNATKDNDKKGARLGTRAISRPGLDH